MNENNTILVSSFYCLQGFVHYTIVIGVTGDWLQSTTGFEIKKKNPFLGTRYRNLVANLWIIIALYCVASGLIKQNMSLQKSV